MSGAILTERARGNRSSLRAYKIRRHMRNTRLKSTSVASTASNMSCTLRLDDSPERPLLGHEQQFETFPGPVYAILNAGLLYCSEQLARLHALDYIFCAVCPLHAATHGS
jgi:hypothetical protein